MWRRTWSSPSTTRTNCTSAEQRTQMARRTPASSSEDSRPPTHPAAGNPARTSHRPDGHALHQEQANRAPEPELPEAACGRPPLVWGRSRERGLQGARLGRGPAQRHILRLMPERQPNATWPKLGAEPGLCEACRHAKLNETRRGTAYLRCTRAAWDVALSRYPRLPATQCEGYERREEKP